MIELVARELKSAGLSVDAATRSVVTSMILHRGEVEFDRLRYRISDLDRYEESAVRTLGVGCSLTQFAMQPVPIAPAYAAQVRALGGLANLIVSAFDAMLDSGTAVPALFSGGRAGDLAHNENREATVLHELVSVYFQQLDLLPRVHDGIRTVIERAIRKMYKAELDSASGTKIARVVWWRKNALPIVVMGFPAWLGVGQLSITEAWRHLRWLCRVGEFFGWIDDCVDLESDGRSGQLNRIPECLQRESERDVTRRIVQQGRAILEGWSTQAGRNIFLVLVWTWLEGTSAASARMRMIQ